MIKITREFDTDPTTGLMNMIFNARIFWRDAALWMLSYLISSVENLEIKEAIRQNLYKMPTQFSSSMRLFFGDQITNTYTNYLTKYIEYLEAYIDAVKAGDINSANLFINLLRDNISLRASILSQINPFWSESEIKTLFNRYLDLLIQVVESYLSGDYDTNVEVFQRLLSHTTKMGDYYSDGLYKYLTYSAQQPPMPKQGY